MEKKYEKPSTDASISEKNHRINAIVRNISRQSTKSAKQKELIRCIQESNFSVDEYNLLYKTVITIEGLNTHNNELIDGFFGIKNTSSWQDILAQLRRYAFTTLTYNLRISTSTEQKIELLDKAKTLPVFTDHRSNSIFRGAWGRTETIIDIDNRKDVQIQKLALSK